MKKFTFTLQTVHDVREIKQEKEELIFSAMQTEVARATERVGEIEARRFAAIEAYGQRMTAGIPLNAYELEMDSRHIAALDRLKREAQATLEAKRQASHRQAEAVAAAARQVKITARLREHQQLRHRLEADRSEQNALDELVSANYARRLAQSK